MQTKSLYSLCEERLGVAGLAQNTESIMPRRNLFKTGALASAFLASAGALAAKRGGGGFALAASPEARLVQRITYGLLDTDLAEATAVGYLPYLEAQLNPGAINDAACDARIAVYTSLNKPMYKLYAYPSGTAINELTDATIVRATFSKRQLFERMVEFWTDHFNVDHLKILQLKHPDDRIIRKHALGNFPDLLRANAHSPCMLVYLDNQLSNATVPNQNYGRELAELHTMGVNGGYSQQDVREIARCLSGWTYYGNTGNYLAGLFRFNPAQHDNLSKVVLGQTIPAGGGQQDGETVLNILLAQPSTAKFVSYKMLRFWLMHEPIQSEVDRIAAIYTKTGGDIKAMLRGILEQNVLTASALKFKRPYHLAISALRGTKATGNANTAVALRNTYLNGMGQIPFRWSPPDGYPDEIAFWAGLMITRWNFAFSLLNNEVSGSTVNVPGMTTGLTTAQQIADRIEQILFGGQMDPEEKTAVINYLLPNPPSAQRTRDAFALAMSGTGFQWY